MALPKIDKPLFDIELPIINQKGKFRPYLVKEEKILLLAQQSEDIDQIILATKQIIGNCMEQGDIDIDRLPSWALEWILIQLRIRSVGESVKASFRDKEDDQVYEFEIKLEDIELKVDPNHTNTIQITDEVGLIMKYPSLDLASMFVNSEDTGYDSIRACIDKVFTENEIMEFDSHTEEEQVQFVEQFSKSEIEKLLVFFDTAPKVEYVVEYTNKKGTERRLELNTLTDFFT